MITLKMKSFLKDIKNKWNDYGGFGIPYLGIPKE